VGEAKDARQKTQNVVVACSGAINAKQDMAKEPVQQTYVSQVRQTHSNNPRKVLNESETSILKLTQLHYKAETLLARSSGLSATLNKLQ
jgi:hypothetical protein